MFDSITCPLVNSPERRHLTSVRIGPVFRTIRAKEPVYKVCASLRHAHEVDIRPAIEKHPRALADTREVAVAITSCANFDLFDVRPLEYSLHTHKGAMISVR